MHRIRLPISHEDPNHRETPVGRHDIIWDDSIPFSPVGNKDAFDALTWIENWQEDFTDETFDKTWGTYILEHHENYGGGIWPNWLFECIDDIHAGHSIFCEDRSTLIRWDDFIISITFATSILLGKIQLLAEEAEISLKRQALPEWRSSRCVSESYSHQQTLNQFIEIFNDHIGG